MKLNILITLLVFTFLNSQVTHAQNTSDTLGSANYTILRDVQYDSDSEQNMDIYLSKETKKNHENYTIVFLHGGGYYYSDKSKEKRFIQPYLEKGFNVVNLNYRLKRGMAIATEDLTNALNFLHENNFRYNLNLKKIVAAGFSAGAHIATIVGVSQNNKEYPHKLNKGIEILGIINFSGPVDGLDVIERIFTEHEMEAARKLGVALFPETEEYASEETISRLEPITYIDKKDPAIFIWHGGRDNQVPPKTFQNFVTFLTANSTKNVVIFDNEAGHSPTDEALTQTYLKIFDFINNL